jgi:hypothetical protein
LTPCQTEMHLRIGADFDLVVGVHPISQTFLALAGDYVLTDMEGPRGTLISFARSFSARLNSIRCDRMFPLLVPEGRRPTRDKARAQQEM